MFSWLCGLRVQEVMSMNPGEIESQQMTERQYF